jgi:hypothetical protein
MCEMSPPSSAASLRVDQCVEPSAGEPVLNFVCEA